MEKKTLTENEVDGIMVYYEQLFIELVTQKTEIYLVEYIQMEVKKENKDDTTKQNKTEKKGIR